MDLAKENSNVKQILWIGVFVFLIINLIQSYFSPLLDDEAYYWAWSQQLDWGYFDHPPLIALWIKMGFGLFQNELGVRLFTAIFNSLLFAIFWFIVNPKNKKQAFLFWAFACGFVLFHAYGFASTPDAPLLFSSALFLLFLKRFISKPNLVNILGLGSSMALVMYSKYHGALVILFSLLPLIPKFYKSKAAYLSIFIGILLYTPHILWQFEHEFVSFNYHIVRRNVFNRFKWNNTTDYILNIFLVSAPLFTFHWIKALFKRKNTSAFERSLIWLFFGVVGFFLLTTLKRYIQAQWLLVAVIPLFILCFEYYKNREKSYKWIINLGIISCVVIGLARIYFMLPNPPIKTQYHGWEEFMKKAGEKTTGIAAFEKYQQTSLFRFYNFPNKSAENYITLEYRNSQYELWDSESSMQGKNVTYFTKFLKSNDSLYFKNKENHRFYIHNSPKFKSAKDLKIDLNYFTYRDSILLDFTINNPTENEFVISKENGLDVVMVITDYQYAEHVKKMQSLNLNDFTLKANSARSFTSKIPLNLESGEYYSYLGISPSGFWPKRQSDSIKIVVP